VINHVLDDNDSIESQEVLKAVPLFTVQRGQGAAVDVEAGHRLG
jgi:hypothetical protein